MIANFIQKTIERLKDPSKSFKERVFIVLTLVTDIVIFIALIFDIALGENIIEIITLIITIIVVPIITMVTVMKKKVIFAVRMIVIGLIVVILPILFFCGGGVEGGGLLWIIFAYLYTGLVLSGRWKVVVMVILTIEAVLFYTVAYYYPEFVYGHSRWMHYFDSGVSLIIVGIVCCMMVWFEEWLFQEENKRAKEETEKIEELIRSQNRFFSSMSHEIRTPINSILGLNEIILRQEDASEEIIKDANNIQGAGRMLLSLVNDILDLSKIEAGKMDIIPVNYNLGTMISEIVNMMWLRAEQKGLEFRLEIDPSIPAELFGDEVRIKQILVNLLNNAIKYTGDGSITLHIEKEEFKGEDILLLFSVIDTGSGIKQDALPYLFDAFRRVDEKKNSKIEGTGLGLAIVKQLVDLMDGKITVNSIYTQGSTFMVTLWQKVTRPDAIGDVSVENYGKTTKRGKYVPGFIAPDAKILIVDDNEMNLEVESKLLEGTEMTIDTAKSAEEALAMTLRERYDIILMDHLMPGTNGIECLQYIRKQSGGLNNHVPVIALTANAGSENRELYNRSGFDGYLVKPVSGQQLEEAMLEHLPELKVTRTDAADLTKSQMIAARGYSKKIPVLVTTSSMCDLPKSVLRDCQIDIIPFCISSQGKKYYDRFEASTDEVMRYSKEGIEFDSSPPTVEEFEKFFGEEIKKAHQIIYITVSPDISVEYENAKEAAQAYGNVKIFNSGCNSGAMGLLVLLAYRLSSQGKSAEKIIRELQTYRKKVSCSFVTGNVDFIMKRGIIGKGIYSFMNLFGIRPVLCVKNGSLNVKKMHIGELGNCYRKYVADILSRRVNPDLDVIIVVYVELSGEDMNVIEKAIRSRYKFEHIFFIKSSACMALNCGLGAIGLAYMSKDHQPYNISQLLTSLMPDEIEADNVGQESYDAQFAEDTADLEMAQSSEDEAMASEQEEIPGIDMDVAIKNSGSEETFRSVLKIFYESIDEKATEIKRFYDEEDWENYTIKVHALKSSARIVGAVELGNESESLEFAGKGNNIDFIREKNEHLLEHLLSFKDILKNVFSCESDSLDEDSGDDNIDRYIIESAYEALKAAAMEQDGTSLSNTLKELSDYAFPDEDAKKLERIRECLSENAFDEIVNLIDGN
nr:DegV family protein [uncultured Butyrivibrio sp.]